MGAGVTDRAKTAGRCPAWWFPRGGGQLQIPAFRIFTQVPAAVRGCCSTSGAVTRISASVQPLSKNPVTTQDAATRALQRQPRRGAGLALLLEVHGLDGHALHLSLPNNTLYTCVYMGVWQGLGALPLTQLGQWPNALRMDSWIAPVNVSSERSQQICNPCWCRRHALSFPPSPEKTSKAYKKKPGVFVYSSCYGLHYL